MYLLSFYRLAFVASFIGLFANVASAQSLDASFNGGEAVVAALPGNLRATARAVTEGKDGSLFVAGNTSIAGNDAGADFLLMHYLPDGSLDNAFGQQGVVITSLNDKRDIAYAVLQQADGKLVLAGGSEGGPAQGSFALARYLLDGSMDSSFNGNGAVITPINIGNISAFALIEQTDGKLLAAGHYNANGFALVRYLSNGALDNSFGNGSGYVITDLGSRAWGNALLQQADGKIVVAGHSGDMQAITLLRYLPDGSLDGSFGDQGVVVTTTGSQHSVAYSVLAQADGKLVVAGSTRIDGTEQQSMVALRYDADGSLDEKFGIGGAAVVSGCSGMVARSIVQQLDGSYLLAGRRQDSGQRVSMVVARLSDSGVLDKSFGDNGVAALSHSTDGHELMNSFKQGSAGRLLAVGSAISKDVKQSRVLLQRLVFNSPQ